MRQNLSETCKKCGDINWRNRKTTSYYKDNTYTYVSRDCRTCAQVRDKKHIKRGRQELRDWAVKEVIINNLLYAGHKILAKDITQEQVEAYRINLLAFRKRNQLKRQQHDN